MGTSPLQSLAPDIDPALPGRTAHGNVWVRYARVSDVVQGFYAVGTRKLDAAGGGFWSSVYTLASLSGIGNTNVDAVHMLSPGNLSVGGLALSQSAALSLLHYCMVQEPDLFTRHMAAPLHAVSAYIEPVNTQRMDAVLVDVYTGERLPARVLERAAKLWVERTSQLLRDALMDGVQLAWLQNFADALLDPATSAALEFIPCSAESVSPWRTRERRALQAIAVVVLLADLPAPAQSMLPQDARDALAALHDLCTRESNRIDARVARAVEVAPRVFGFKPPWHE